MSVRWIAIMTGSVLLGLLIVFQILLALGLPLGAAAWGGQHRVLPTNLRWMSAMSVLILAFAGWIFLARAGVVSPGANQLMVRVLAWIFTGYFALNILMNLFLSHNALERGIMTPTSLLLTICYLLVSRL